MINRNDSRTKNTVRNIGSGVINKIISIILPFINRTAILWTLGSQFTGLSSLFSSILNVLNIAELGFNSAVVFSLYEPMANQDKGKIIDIVSLLRRVYNTIGTVILLLGIIILPFLPYLIKGTYPNTVNIYILYLLYLIDSVISYYLFAYKECLLIADQRQDVSNNIRTIVNISRYLLQLLVLIVTKNFYYYMVVSIIGTVVTNVFIHFSTKKRYSFFKISKTKKKMPKSMITQVRGLMINRICDTFRNSFDSIIISSFIGLTATAIYSNYYYVYSSLYGLMLVICNAMSASVGNSIVKKSENENFNDMLVFSHLFSIILGISTACLFCLYQPFMKLWAGKKLMLSMFDMSLFTIYYYVINMNNIRNQYISGTGIWDKLKTSYVVEAIANLILNFVLGKYLGITGVILATIITIFAFNYLQRNKVLFNVYFKNQKISLFYKEQFYYLFVALTCSLCSYFLCNCFSLIGVYDFIVKACISILTSSFITYFMMKLSNRYDDSKVMVLKIKNILLKKKNN